MNFINIRNVFILIFKDVLLMMLPIIYKTLAILEIEQDSDIFWTIHRYINNDLRKQIVQTRGDGDCYFNAVIEYIIQNRKIDLIEKIITKVKQLDGSSLRKYIYDCVYLGILRELKDQFYEETGLKLPHPDDPQVINLKTIGDTLDIGMILSSYLLMLFLRTRIEIIYPVITNNDISISSNIYDCKPEYGNTNDIIQIFCYNGHFSGIKNLDNKN